MDLQFESEAEVGRNPREAVVVVEHEGKPRAFTTDPCQDKTSGEGVRLRGREKELSDIKRNASVPICDHHTFYVAACSGRKCSVLSCSEIKDGARQDVPLYRQHLFGRPPRKVSWHEDPESAFGTDSSLPEEEKVPRKNNAPFLKAKSSLFSPTRRWPASSEPRTSIQRRIEGQLERP